MDPMAYDAVTWRVKEIMVEVLVLDLSAEQLHDDLVLDSSTVKVDSLNLLELIVRLEKEFGAEVDDHAVFEANLRDVGNLIDLVRRELVS